MAVVSVRGEEAMQINLNEYPKEKILSIDEIECNPNVVEAYENQIRIKNSTCPEQLCVRTGYFSKLGQTIVCLPHQVIIEIKTMDTNVEEVILGA